MPPRPDGASPNPPPNKYAQNLASTASALEDALPARPGSSQSSGNRGTTHTLFPRRLAGVLGTAWEEADRDTPGWQTRPPKPPLFLPGPGRASSGWGQWSLPPGVDVGGGCLAPEQGGPHPSPHPRAFCSAPSCCPVPGAQGAGRRGPFPPCRDPAGAANHRSSGSLQERKRNDRERGVRWEPGGAGQEPPPSVLTQDVEFAQRAGLLEHQPGVHAVSVELMLTGQHPEPLRGSGGRELRPQGRPPVGVPGPVPSPELGTETPVARRTFPPPPATTCSASQISGGAGRRPVGALPRCVGSRAAIIAPAALCPGY